MSQKSLLESITEASKNRTLMEQKKEKSRKFMARSKDNMARRHRTRRQLLNNEEKHEDGRLKIGKMYFYTYDAKTKEKMPYWDYYPLVLPYAYTANGFYGLNLHYLPPRFRAQILDEIIKFKRNGDMSQPTANLIKAVATMNVAKPAIHRYLYSQIVGFPVTIEMEDWEETVYLPLADWRSVKRKSVNTLQVYADSKRRM